MLIAHLFWSSIGEGTVTLLPSKSLVDLGLSCTEGSTSGRRRWRPEFRSEDRCCYRADRSIKRTGLEEASMNEHANLRHALREREELKRSAHAQQGAYDCDREA